MSTYLAIATVTATLKRLLQEAAQEAVGAAKVHTVRPGSATGTEATAPGIDLYLYHVTPNAALRNNDLPTRRADGQLCGRPRVALDLHYLLSFRGDDEKLEPQLMLGNVLRAMQAAPVLTRKGIQDTLGEPDFGFLADSDLADAEEQIKFSPVPLSIEEMSKLWSVLYQTPYTLSIAYLASVIVIDDEESYQRALPVLQRRLSVVPFRHPWIDSVQAASGPEDPIVAGTTLILEGRQLRATGAFVRVGDVPAEPDLVADTQITVTLGAPGFPPDSLRAGPQGISVTHPILSGSAPLNFGFDSNVAAFVLRPVLGAVSSPDSQSLTLTVVPTVGQGQRITVFLNENVPSQAEAYAFPGDPLAADADTFTVKTPGIKTGTQYFVRVQIDGAESVLELDPLQPTFGPTVNIP